MAFRTETLVLRLGVTVSFEVLVSRERVVCVGRVTAAFVVITAIASTI